MPSPHEQISYKLDKKGFRKEVHRYAAMRNTHGIVDALTIFDAELAMRTDIKQPFKLFLMERALRIEQRFLDPEDPTTQAIQPFVRQNKHEIKSYIRSRRIKNGRHCRTH